MKKPTKPIKAKPAKRPFRFVVTEGAPISASAFIKGLEALGIGNKWNQGG